MKCRITIYIENLKVKNIKNKFMLPLAQQLSNKKMGIKKMQIMKCQIIFKF